MQEIDISGWPDCPIKGCRAKVCRVLDSRWCFVHTPGNEHVKRLDIDVSLIVSAPPAVRDMFGLARPLAQDAPDDVMEPAEFRDPPDALDEAVTLLGRVTDLPVEETLKDGSTLVTSDGPVNARRILELTVAEAVRRMRAKLFTDEGQ